MNKVVKRLLTFFIGIPLVIAITLLDFHNYLALNIAVSVFAVLGCNELYNMFATQAKMFPKWLLLLLTFSIHATAYLFEFLKIDMIVNIWVMIFEVILLMGIESFCHKNNKQNNEQTNLFGESIKKISYSSFILFYVGFMATLISYISYIENNATYFLILFFLISFSTDSFAWFFGVLFGKNNRGFIAASPNKSIAGFVGGILTTLVISILIKYFFPNVFTGSYYKIVIISLATSIGAIVGDLFESVIKRSAGFKDSGSIIPGRGGVLDSIDSLLISGPIFYLCVYYLYLV